MKQLAILGLCVLSLQNVFAQSTHEHGIALDYLQIKEELNYGLVFRGSGLHYSYLHQWQNPHHVLEYKAQLGFSYVESRGIGGGQIHVAPLDFTYLFKVGANAKMLVGPSLVADYKYQLYPDLQSGYSFWFTNFSLGGKARYPVEIAGQQFSLQLQTTILGFISRPPVSRDEYFFDLSFGYALEFLHQDLRFASLNRYNGSSLEILWKPKRTGRLAYAYVLDYAGYYTEPKFTLVNQSLKLILLPKPKKP